MNDTLGYRRRWEVLVRDDFTCRYCGQFAPNVQLEVDHVTPRSEGGSDDLDNLVTACWACNRGKEYYRASTAFRARRALPPLRTGPTAYEQARALLLENPMIPIAELAEAVGITPGIARVYRARARRASGES